MSHSSSPVGRRPLKAVTRVQISYAILMSFINIDKSLATTLNLGD